MARSHYKAEKRQKELAKKKKKEDKQQRRLEKKIDRSAKREIASGEDIRDDSAEDPENG